MLKVMRMIMTILGYRPSEQIWLGPRELRSCLRENAGKLSPECRAARPSR